MMKKTFLLLATAAAAAALLAACGGGGGGDTATGPAPVVMPAPQGSEVPAAATQDAGAAYEFVASKAASSSDTSEPLVVGDAMLATSDSDEPRPQ